MARNELNINDVDAALKYLPYFKDKTNSFYTIEKEISMIHLNIVVKFINL